MQVFDINIGVNGSRQIDVQANYIYFLNGSAGGADTTIGFRPESGGETVFLKPGQAYKLPAGQRMGMRWTMFNVKNEGAIVGQVLMGEGEFYDNRVSGSVEVISGEKMRVLSGNSFGGSALCNPVAGMHSMVQIYNPAGSGRNAFVNRIVLGGSAAGEWLVTLTPTELANPVGAGFYANKRADGAQSLSRRRSEARALLGATVFDVFVNANEPLDLIMNEPLMLPPGYGLCVTPYTLGVLGVANFQFYEDVI